VYADREASAASEVAVAPEGLGAARAEAWRAEAARTIDADLREANRELGERIERDRIRAQYRR
jgi:hypothetical protein